MTYPLSTREKCMVVDFRYLTPLLNQLAVDALPIISYVLSLPRSILGSFEQLKGKDILLSKKTPKIAPQL